MSRTAMRRLSMSVFLPERRRSSGYLVKWRDPVSGLWRQKTLGVKLKRDAYALAMDLAEQIVSGVSPDGLSWLEFCGLYEQQRLKSLSSKSIESWRTTKWHVETLAPLRTMQQATPGWVSRFQGALRKRGLSINSVATYSARLRAALLWGERQRLIERAPYVAVDVEEAPRSRAITFEEFERMLMTVPKIRRSDAALWDRLLRGQWESGLRISELVQLSWDDDAAIALVSSGRLPLIQFRKQKNKKRQWGVVTPEFWAICCETPPECRMGPVFTIPGRGGQMTPKRIIRNIAAIGKRAGIITDPEKGKTATSHDIRRALPIRLQEQGKLSIVEIHKLMRHAKLDTTLTYYDTRGAEEIAAKLWAT